MEELWCNTRTPKSMLGRKACLDYDCWTEGMNVHTEAYLDALGGEQLVALPQFHPTSSATFHFFFFYFLKILIRQTFLCCFGSSKSILEGWGSGPFRKWERICGKWYPLQLQCVCGKKENDIFMAKASHGRQCYQGSIHYTWLGPSRKGVTRLPSLVTWMLQRGNRPKGCINREIGR